MNIVFARILFFSCVFSLGWSNVHSQSNIARNSAASHSGGGQTIFGYGPDRYNDGVKTQGSGIFGWVATTGNPCTNGCWIQFDWTTSQIMGQMVILNESNSNRTLTGGTIQYWNGSAWINLKTFSVSPALKFTVDFTPVATKSLRISSIVTSGTQNTNPAVNEIEIYNTFNHDAGFKSVEYVCCNGTQPVFATLSNFGAKTIDSVWVFWQLNGVNQNSFLLKKQIAPSKDTLIFLGNANFAGNTLYNIKAWTSKPNNKLDSVPANDTTLKKNYVFKKPGKPSIYNQNVCGCAFPILKGKGDLNTSLIWSSAADPDLIIGQGDSISDKNKFCPPSMIRYAATSFNGQSDTFKQSLTQTWSITGGSANYDKGIYFNIKPSQTIYLDKIFQSITDNGNSTIATYDVEIYYKKGSYVGSENIKNNWKLVGEYSIQNTNLISGGLAQKTVPLNISTLRLLEDSLYSICINIVNADQWLRFNAINSGIVNVEYKNNLVKVYSGALFYNSWGSKVLFPGFAPENWLAYRFGCLGDTIHQLNKMNPMPSGTQLKKGSIFQTTMPNTAGTLIDPDIVAADDTFSYEFNPPTGYNNSTYSTNWAISKISLRTRNGNLLSSKYYKFISPTAFSNGVILLTLDSLWIDTPLVLQMYMRDIGPYFCDTLLVRYIFVSPRPQIMFKAFSASICDGDDVLFENTSKISSGVIKYFWDFGTGNPDDTSNAFSPVFKFPQFGTYNVKLKGISIPFGYVSIKTLQVVVNEIPNVKFDKTNACEGEDVILTNKTTMSILQPINYFWDLGDKNNRNTKDVKHRYSNTGGYLVSLTATSNGCSNTIFKNVYQFAKPSASFNIPGTLFCSNRNIVFENKSTISFGLAGSNWFFDDGDISTDDNPKHLFELENEYNVKLVMVSEFGCKDSFFKKLVVKETPIANFINDQPCDLKPTNFTNKTIHGPLYNPTFKWDFGDTTFSTQLNPIKTWSSLGPKVVKLSAYSLSGCSDSITKKITVQPNPIVNFEVFDQCSGRNVQLNNNTYVKQGNLIYEWKFGDGRSSNDRIPVFQYNIGTTITFNISLKSYADIGCSDSITKSVTISENPNCAFIAERNWTLGSRGMSFTPNNTTYASYFWQFGDGGSSTQTKTKYTYLYDLIYPVTLSAINSAGCDCKISKDIDVNSISNLKSIYNNEVKFYPTFSNGTFYIEVGSDNKRSFEIQFTDLQGRVVYCKEYLDSKGIVVFDLNYLSSGLYNVHITRGNIRTISKVIIQK